MKIISLWGQRVCRYPGQYAPEIIDMMTEYQNEENSEWLEEKEKQAVESGEFSSVAIIEISVNEDKIRSILNDLPEIDGIIK